MVARGTWLGLILMLSGCGEDDGTTNTFTNDGSLCFRSQATDSVEVLVTFDTCLSSSCSHVIEASCSVAETNGTIQVESRAVVENDSGECTADCGLLTAQCESAPISAGTYPVTYGANADSIVLPATAELLFPTGNFFEGYCE